MKEIKFKKIKKGVHSDREIIELMNQYISYYKPKMSIQDFKIIGKILQEKAKNETIGIDYLKDIFSNDVSKKINKIKFISVLDEN